MQTQDLGKGCNQLPHFHSDDTIGSQVVTHNRNSHNRRSKCLITRAQPYVFFRYSPPWKEEVEKARVSGLADLLTSHFRQIVQQVRNYYQDGFCNQKSFFTTKKLFSTRLKSLKRGSSWKEEKAACRHWGTVWKTLLRQNLLQGCKERGSRFFYEMLFHK